MSVIGEKRSRSISHAGKSDSKQPQLKSQDKNNSGKSIESFFRGSPVRHKSASFSLKDQYKGEYNNQNEGTIIIDLSDGPEDLVDDDVDAIAVAGTNITLRNNIIPIRQDFLCPVCNITFKTFANQVQEETHVNLCLDSAKIPNDKSNKNKEENSANIGSKPVEEAIKPESLKLKQEHNTNDTKPGLKNLGTGLWNKFMNKIAGREEEEKIEFGGKPQNEELLNENYNNERGIVRTCPWYKKMPGTRLAVDAFRFGKVPQVNAYLLT